jgi:hypothetical protein
MDAMKNSFWIGANVLFDLEKWKTTEVMLLVSQEDWATNFQKAGNEKREIILDGRPARGYPRSVR